MKKKILISAYAISPYKGSEYGAAWNTVINLSSKHELWVLYGMSDDHMGDTQTMRKFLENNEVPNVRFVEVQPGPLARAINLLNKAGLGWFFYFAYTLWQKEAYKAARQLLVTEDIDVVHQLGPIGYREPGFLYRLGKPMVWGPIGGMMVIDKCLMHNKPLLTQIKFGLKNIINQIQLGYSARIKQAFEHADVLISATRAGQQTIMNRFDRESYYLSEQGIIGSISLNEAKFTNGVIQLIWCGTHIERKNLQLCLDALAQVRQSNWQLHVLGCGPLTGKLKQYAGKLGLNEKITWHGQLNRSEAIQMMAASHLHIITSIAEDNPAVVFEAMSCGVPSLTINHHGMGDVISSENGIKVPVNEYPVLVNDIAKRLDELFEKPYLLQCLAYTTIANAGAFQWDARLNLLNRIYDEAIMMHEKRNAYLLPNENLIAL
ncbi:glycosyltransferase [Mucilaginibacter celer]|uniref:Glycosyltransferase n=1 Tax=Mucilaginibacter celer TaxID=2305508 RepID=A0A494VJU3_9SPHI|nr:glycosyltransferase [Mucilaginibacter celer]AYL94594.1 glycosyltransferase [Mucilaginibacter celer]